MKTFLRFISLATAAGLLASAGYAVAQDTNNAALPATPSTVPTPAPTTPTIPAAPTGLTASTDVTSTNTPPAKPKKRKKKKAAVDSADSTASASSKAITGDVTKVDDDAKTLTVSGQDKPFGITSKTKITKNGDPAILLDIVAGDHVTIRAKNDATGNPLATSIRVGQVKAKKKKARKESDSMTPAPETTTPAAAPATPTTPTVTPTPTPAPAAPPATGGTQQ